MTIFVQPSSVQKNLSMLSNLYILSFLSYLDSVVDGNYFDADSNMDPDTYFYFDADPYADPNPNLHLLEN
jgi:hypothetical protein